jgi:signal transduction histidine kinase/ActR/RegA family two-component response regulator
VRWIRDRATPLRDPDGKVVRVTGVAEDITDRRELEDQLRQAQKMEAIGSLAGGIAHDFNNILSVILTYAEMTLGDLQTGDPMRDDLQEIKDAGLRAADLTRQLLAFSRRQILQPKVIDLNLILARMEKMLRRLIGEDIELTVIPSSSAASVNVDPGQMEQVIMNLAVNARDAMQDGGKLTIAVEAKVLDATCALEHGSRPGPHVMLAVTDTGVGMDAATQAHIFEPFFTTKEQGKGTGLGLSMVFGIVRQSGGSIRVRSEPQHGTSFEVYLPQVAADVAEQEQQPQRPALHGSETVLLVEDDEMVRKVARAVLERHGYHVLEAHSGGDALVICEQNPDVDLLLTDIVMPRMSGAQLATRLTQARPDLKVLFMSGYTDDTVLLHGVLHAQVAFLQKPFTPQALLTRVRETLDSNAAGTGPAACQDIRSLRPTTSRG